MENGSAVLIRRVATGCNFPEHHLQGSMYISVATYLYRARSTFFPGFMAMSVQRHHEPWHKNHGTNHALLVYLRSGSRSLNRLVLHVRQAGSL